MYISKGPCLTMFGTIWLKTKRIAVEKNTKKIKKIKKKKIKIKNKKDPRGSLAMLQVVVNNCG
jgi:hypothetical protein